MVDHPQRRAVREPGRGDARRAVETSIGDPGLYRATITVTVDGRRASGSVDFKVEYVCGPSLSPDVIDLRAETSAVVTVTSDCVGTNVFEVAVAPWLSGPASVTVPQGGSGTITVVRSTGQPPSDGDHQDAVVVTYRTGSIGVMEGRASVQANRSPDMSFPADMCSDMERSASRSSRGCRTTASPASPSRSTARSYPMLQIAPPDGYRIVVDKALLGSATTWLITALDTNGLPQHPQPGRARAGDVGRRPWGGPARPVRRRAARRAHVLDDAVGEATDPQGVEVRSAVRRVRRMMRQPFEVRPGQQRAEALPVAASNTGVARSTAAEPWRSGTARTSAGRPGPPNVGTSPGPPGGRPPCWRLRR